MLSRLVRLRGAGAGQVLRGGAAARHAVNQAGGAVPLLAVEFCGDVPAQVDPEPCSALPPPNPHRLPGVAVRADDVAAPPAPVR